MPIKTMGILNVTPDSFSDGGEHSLPQQALQRAKIMIAEGADIIDIGGESSRPGAKPVPLDAELKRVLPVVELLLEYIQSNRLNVQVSIDTYKPEVMRRVMKLGVHMINDIRALQEPGALEACVEYDAQVCLMHMQGRPETMQLQPVQSTDITSTVYEFLRQRVRACVDAGLSKANIILDPGFGFGKTFDQNWALLSGLASLKPLDCPILVGTSRKSMLGTLLDKPTGDRLPASIASVVLALERGASVLRVHDVGPTKDAVRVFEQVVNKR